MHGARKLKVIAVAALALGAFGLARAETTITGAGSTWVYPLIANWAATYRRQTGVQVNYQSIGSGGGIQQIKVGTVSFGASDMPLKPEELARNHLVQFPTAIAGAAMVVNLPGVKPGGLVLSGAVIARIYLGEIRNWNDPEIAALNKGLRLPDMAITCVHRADGSGTTFTFSNYLAKVSPQWAQKIGFSTAVSWPTGVGGKGNEGVAAYVQRIAGSIGYVEYAYVVENRLTYARMVNRDGKVVAPGLKSFQSAAAQVDLLKEKDFYVILTDQPGADTWPLSGCTWQILRVDAPAGTNQQVVKFFRWAFEHGQQQAREIDFAPLPESTVRAIERYWKTHLGI